MLLKPSKGNLKKMKLPCPTDKDNAPKAMAKAILKSRAKGKKGK